MEKEAVTSTKYSFASFLKNFLYATCPFTGSDVTYSAVFHIVFRCFLSKLENKLQNEDS